MNTRILFTSAILAAVASANADFGTFASFFDTGTASFNRSTVAAGAGLLTASGTGYTLVSGGDVYNDVSFDLVGGVTYQAAGIDALTDKGRFVFTQGTTTLLTIDFDSATLSGNGLHASFNNGGFDDNVVFGGDIITNGSIVIDPLDPQAGFDFSFANPNDVGGGRSYSSAFSASANFTPVPEPASMAALGMGALALVRRRRKA